MELSQNGISHSQQSPTRDNGLTNGVPWKARMQVPLHKFHHQSSCTYH